MDVKQFLKDYRKLERRKHNVPFNQEIFTVMTEDEIDIYEEDRLFTFDKLYEHLRVFEEELGRVAYLIMDEVTLSILQEKGDYIKKKRSNIASDCYYYYLEDKNNVFRKYSIALNNDVGYKTIHIVADREDRV